MCFLVVLMYFRNLLSFVYLMHFRMFPSCSDVFPEPFSFIRWIYGRVFCLDVFPECSPSISRISIYALIFLCIFSMCAPMYFWMSIVFRCISRTYFLLSDVFPDISSSFWSIFGWVLYFDVFPELFFYPMYFRIFLFLYDVF